MRLSHSAKSDIGLVRKINQDRWVHANCDWGDLFVVADGMGHEKGGQFSSQTVVDSLKQEFSQRDPRDIPAFLRNALNRINQIIYEEKMAKYKNAMMGSTCVVLAIQDNEAYLAHVGDTRAYYLHDGELTQLTKDQSLVQEMVDEGLLSSAQAEGHPNKNIITEALGALPDVNVDFRTDPLALSSGDRFLICSDGLWGSVSRRELRNIFAMDVPDSAAEKLINLANRNGGPDNITVQVIYVG